VDLVKGRLGVGSTRGLNEGEIVGEKRKKEELAKLKGAGKAPSVKARESSSRTCRY